MLPEPDNTKHSQHPAKDKKPSKKLPASEEELQQQALEEYQKLGPDDDNSVDILQRPWPSPSLKTDTSPRTILD